MKKKIRSFKEDGLKQTNLITFFKKVPSSKEKETNQNKETNTVGDEEEQNLRGRRNSKSKRKLPFSLSDSEEDFNGTTLTPVESTLQNVRIHQNIILSSSMAGQTLNYNIEDLCNSNEMTITEMSSDIKTTTKLVNKKGNSAAEVSSDNNESEISEIAPVESNLAVIPSVIGFPTPKKSIPKSLQSPSKLSPSKIKVASPKKEERGINKDFLKIITELITNVLNSKHLKAVLGEDMRILNNVLCSKSEYQYVCFKLYVWLPKWYNLFNFCKKINSNLVGKEVIELFEFLKNNDIVDTDYKNENIGILLNLLDHSDVKSICETFRKKGRTKKEMIQELLSNCITQSTLTVTKSMTDLLLEEIIKKFGNTVVRIKGSFQKAFYHYYLLGTFANPMFRDIHEYIREMQQFNIDFPDYQVQDYNIFYTRAEFLSYAKACEYRDNFEELVNAKDYVRMLQMGKEIVTNLTSSNTDMCEQITRFQETPHLKRFTEKSVYINTLTKIADKLRGKYFHSVKDWLHLLIDTFPSSHKVGDWYFDLCVIYMNHLKGPETNEKAAKLLIEVFKNHKDHLTEYQIQNLSERSKLLTPRINQLLHENLIELIPVPISLDDFPQTTVDSKTVRENVTGKKRHYQEQGADGSKIYKFVEQVALDFYINRCGYTDGIHCEGSVIVATFALFFWDIIYNPEVVVPGSFISKLQQTPLDMYTPYFYTNRKKLIDKRLKDIAEHWSDDKTIDFIKENWSLYSHKTGLCTIGNVISDPKYLKIFVECIGRTTLSKIYERLVKNFGQYRSGMPDLLVWNEKNQTAKWIEVKGENDKLSVKQKLWLNFLKSIDANIEVCHVHSIGSKKKLKPTKLLMEEESASSFTLNTPKKKVTPRKTKPKTKIYTDVKHVSDFESSSSSEDFTVHKITLTTDASKPKIVKNNSKHEATSLNTKVRRDSTDSASDFDLSEISLVSNKKAGFSPKKRNNSIEHSLHSEHSPNKRCKEGLINKQDHSIISGSTFDSQDSVVSNCVNRFNHITTNKFKEKIFTLNKATQTSSENRKCLINKENNVQLNKRHSMARVTSIH